MSNHYAIATVSAVLRNLVAAAAGTTLNGVPTTVETGRPDRLVPPDDQAAVSIFLYQVMRNPHLRSEDLATRRADSSLAQKSREALDLYYLLTFFGLESQQQPELLLGGVATALHTEPSLSRALIEQVLANEAHLAESDLAEQPELIRVVPVDLALEDLSTLWSVFFQTSYRLSVAYKASVVFLSGDRSNRRPS